MMRKFVFVVALTACHPTQGPKEPTHGGEMRRRATPASAGIDYQGTPTSQKSAPASQPEKVRPPLLPSGSLAPEKIAAVIGDSAPAFQRCYREKSPRLPRRIGRVHVRATINVEGRVRNVTLMGSTLREPAVEACVREVVKAMVFPKPRGGEVVIRTPLYFGKGAEAPTPQR